MFSGFHPAVAAWFAGALGRPTPAQEQGWPAIAAGRHTLIAAPTGSGKTLAAFLCAIDELVRAAARDELKDELYAVYVSPLKALSHDIEKNLQAPLSGIEALLARGGRPAAGIRVFVRTGDTPAHERAAAQRRPPHILVTTPESLYILLTSDGGRRMLGTARVLIVDEIHAVAGNKRGAHLGLSVERLERLVWQRSGRRLQRIGLSATQQPIDEVARLLVGTGSVGAGGAPDCAIVDLGHRRDLDLAIEVPGSPLEAVASAEHWLELQARLGQLIAEHRTTLVFVNTRRLCERLTRSLSEALGQDAVAAHHGSLARKHRLDAEERLKSGALRAMVATSSLELGIDIGEVDLVCQIGSTRAIATLLQRVGRSAHRLGGVPRGRLFPLNRGELCECAALLDAVRRGELDRLVVPKGPLDILAQQIVAASAVEDLAEEELLSLARRAWPYRELSGETLGEVLRMLADGFSTARGRRSAHVHRDGVNRRIRGRRGAKIAAITGGGAIPDTADYDVLLEPAELKVGTVNEDFAIESMAGDIFQLGNVSYRIRRVEPGKVRVEDARGEPPTVPFWLGESPGRSAALSAAVSRLRNQIAARLDATDEDGVDPGPADPGEEARSWLADEIGIGQAAAQQVVDYLAAAQRALGALPTHDALILERFFDEVGNMHLVLHAPFGSRINRAFGLALRKCFCRRFNFELQAAATEDGLSLSLGPTHSFALDEVWGYLKPETARGVLTQALLDAPMFGTRWRWNATRALAVPRMRGGRKTPPPLLRMLADDLLTVCFPDKVACQENLAGEREIPNHPLVQQTVDDCLSEAMDADGLLALLQRIAGRDIALLARDVREPSPLAAEILTARPYAFLDDAPLEERRTQAVMSRRWLDPRAASDLGALDAAAIERVRQEAWPAPRDPDELHDALVMHGLFSEEEGRRGQWQDLFAALRADSRATVIAVAGERRWVAAERLPQIESALDLSGMGEVAMDPPIAAPAGAFRSSGREQALVELVRGRLECEGPTTCAQLAAALCVSPDDAGQALIALEVEGFALRGRFSREHAVGADREEWCERRLLARIHRYTLARLRSEIEPVSAADYLRFLTHWQHVSTEDALAGPAGLSTALGQLTGFEAPARAWESDLLPSRLAGYDPAWLDGLCLSGRFIWARRSACRAAQNGSGPSLGRGPIRTTPIALLARDSAASWLSLGRGEGAPQISSRAQAVLAALGARGACFFDDLVRQALLLPSELEVALGELVGAGLCTSDGFSGLRALIATRRLARARPWRRAGACTMESAGRWAMIDASTAGPPSDGGLEIIAWTLLRRWGVVFRRLLDREGPLPPWRDLLRALRRLEARGEIRGGRFVAGFAGEQYALIEAVGPLRRARRDRQSGKHSGELCAISAADPLNLAGILTPGKRIAARTKNRLLLRDGVPIAVREGGEARLLDGAQDVDLPSLQRALLRRPVIAPSRRYFGSAP